MTDEKSGQEGRIDFEKAKGNLSYNSYLRIPELLELQKFESDPPAHDELLFIVIHQAYELWFKQILFEIDSVSDCMAKDDVYEASRLLQRVLEIEKLLVQQIHLLETMTPRDFLSFRAALNPASGFQSIQFREVEFATGIKDRRVIEGIELTDDDRVRLHQRLDAPSLRTDFYELLQRLNFDVRVPPDEGDEDTEISAHNLHALKELYSHPEKYFHVYSLAENLVSHDQNILLWRFHHVRVVERLIGTKMGTGGSPGVRYLESTLRRRAFPDLWSVRGTLEDAEFYGTSKGPSGIGLPSQDD